jgi:predicted Zn-dependent protease
VLIVNPFAGAVSLTLFVGWMLVLRGILAMVAAFRVRPLEGWGWLVVDSLANLAAGLLIIVKWPSSTACAGHRASRKAQLLGYARDVESRADLTGADICAAAGVNPWGLVWLFNDFQDAQVGQAPELLADHPNNVHRIQALEEHFKKAPSVFGKFNSDPRSATSMKLPADTAETFLR